MKNKGPTEGKYAITTNKQNQRDAQMTADAGHIHHIGVTRLKKNAARRTCMAPATYMQTTLICRLRNKTSILEHN